MSKRKYEMEKILTSPDKGISATRGIGGILARLWRQILDDLQVKPNKFELLLSDFINSAKRGVPEHRISRHFTRGNLRRELEQPTMTFKVFIKGMKFLKVVRIRFVVELEHSGGRKTLHETAVDLGGGSDAVTDIFEDEMSKKDPDAS